MGCSSSIIHTTRFFRFSSGLYCCVDADEEAGDEDDWCDVRRIDRSKSLGSSNVNSSRGVNFNVMRFIRSLLL